VGYAGGTKKNPTYHDLGDHAETIEVDFDPRRVTYDELLEVFWTNHNATRRPWSRQYASIIFVHDDEQARLARESKERFEATLGRRVYTEIVPYENFTLAEDYHQKFRLRGHHDVAAEYLSIYPRLQDFVNSTAVTRVNGFLGGCGSCLQLDADLPKLGLTSGTGSALRSAVCGR